MASNYFDQRLGPGAIHTTTTQTASLSNSLLNTAFNPAPRPAPQPAGPQVERLKVHPCTWPGCPRLFACPHNVQQHIREKHTFERPYKCMECAADGSETAFTRQYGLNRHRLQVHAKHDKPARSTTRASAEAGQSNVMGGTPATFPTAPQAVAPPPQWPGEDAADAMMRMLLVEENARMKVEGDGAGLGGGDAEMSDEPYQFDFPDDNQAETSDEQFQFETTEAQNVSGGRYGCGYCNFSSATMAEVFPHIHLEHGMPNSRFCNCVFCSLMHEDGNNEAFKPADTFAGGPMPAATQDASFTQSRSSSSFLGILDMLRHGGNTSGSQIGNGSTGWQSDIDPALLSEFPVGGTFDGTGAMNEGW